jgi:heme-degrading monooxygenase HmoA
MVIVVFRTHVKPQVDLEQLNALHQKMVALVSTMPGFLSVKDFSAPDGEFLVIAEFDSLESVDAWKAHPEHRVAQRRGREEFFADYRIQVCTCSALRTSQPHPDNSIRTIARERSWHLD